MTFNMLFGNADAHARNYSLLLHPDGTVTLAPLYDLVCTRMFPQLSTTAAQHVAGVDDIDEVSLEDLVDEAIHWGLPRPAAARTVTRTADRMRRAVDRSARHTHEAGGDRDVIDHVVDLVLGRLEEHSTGAS